MITQKDLQVDRLGPCQYPSPLIDLLPEHCDKKHFISDDRKVVFDATLGGSVDNQIPMLELAGPREKIFHDPSQTTAAIVTCGGICPGLNDVIRSLVMTLFYRYGVKNILGIRYGYQGFIENYQHEPIQLTPEKVTNIHEVGGTLLGTSRGEQDCEKIVDFLEKRKINVLFVIGGDGTLRGALAIAKVAERRNTKISIIGIPKTVDNDILYVDRSFGFATAVSVACRAVITAHSEAISQVGGIGLVKLMGRHSGYIASLAALATSHPNFVLIPEVPFDLEGGKGFLEALRQRLEKRGHAVILVAEGAGQRFFEEKDAKKDASGNVRLKDIGLYLKDRINAYFKERQIEANLKYIDPSYIIRAVESMPVDKVYCIRLAQNAVHAAMSGRTKMVVGLRNNQHAHFPIEVIAQGRQQVDPGGDLWLSVLESTGQPAMMFDEKKLSSQRAC